ncbi:DUF927 domain-containing protein [Xenorhabdus miraniensis]|nr:DUF927 domain-containing protein [Xenorhabdus miraniensis]
MNITVKNSLLPILAEHLQRSGDRREWIVTQKAGWHCGAYVMPDGEIIGQPYMPVAFSGGTSAIVGYVVRGTTEEWKIHVASLLQGNRSMMLCVLMGLSAPLNSLTGGTYGRPNGDIDTSYAMRISDLAGYLVHNRRNDGQAEYHIIPSVFEAEILQGLQKKSGFEALEEAGMLVKAEKDRFISKTISVNGTQGRFVVLIFRDED